MSWTQPICRPCWTKDNPGQHPVLLITVQPERCCQCGDLTLDGIYVRRDPATVLFPSEEE